MRIAIAILLLSAAVFCTESKYILVSKRVSSGAVAISCTNGADPTGTTVGDALIISCGK